VELIHVTASLPLGMASRNATLRAVLDDQKNIQLISLKPDKFAKEKYQSERRIFAPDFLKNISPGEYVPLFHTDTPNNNWISITQSNFSASNGGKIILKFEQPGKNGGSFPLTFQTPQGPKTETISGNIELDLSKVTENGIKKWVVSYKGNPFSNLTMHINYKFPASADLGSVTFQ
jgi:hypothetical protein